MVAIVNVGALGCYELANYVAVDRNFLLQTADVDTNLAEQGLI